MTGLVAIGMMVSGAGGRYGFQVGLRSTPRIPILRPHDPPGQGHRGAWVFLWCALGGI